MGSLDWTVSLDLRVSKVKEETQEREENQAEMGLDSRDPQDLLDLQARSSTRTQAVLTTLLAESVLREDLGCPVRLDFLAQLDLKETEESLVCPDTVRRGRRASLGWWWDLMEMSSDWRASQGSGATEDLWDPLDLLDLTALRE